MCLSGPLIIIVIVPSFRIKNIHLKFMDLDKMEMALIANLLFNRLIQPVKQQISNLSVSSSD